MVLLRFCCSVLLYFYVFNIVCTIIFIKVAGKGVPFYFWLVKSAFDCKWYMFQISFVHSTLLLQGSLTTNVVLKYLYINSRQANKGQRWLQRSHLASSRKIVWIGLILRLCRKTVPSVLEENDLFTSNKIQGKGRDKKFNLTVFWQKLWFCLKMIWFLYLLHYYMWIKAMKRH